MVTSTGKTVLITGGNRGLGKALVECFKNAGWFVIATARNPDTLPGGIFAGHPLDLSVPQDIDNLVSKIDTPIDCIIHNAGFNPKDVKTPGYFESTFRLQHFRADAVAEACYINALRPMELTGKLLPVMTKYCIVIAISSWLGSTGQKSVAGHDGYCGSTALLNHCIKGMAMEFDKAPDENRVAIALNPGWMKTDMGGGDRADISPEEVASRLISMIDDGFLRENNGKFLNTDRSDHAW